ncbi:uncharacterized protein EV420DRAFT_1043131 [Desarmillaria tabescens]|uniref:Transmembrane protein n=1 Tax=Armillaria tabescens TaxID=1929756 RepID=A0AA39T4M9_ARMTA|nr:uncharacterized protein EV420DRAFT_1043131 [Desarmillaria tabescens]KAK0464441.1 hypothetical protein EV420DRAFT_1043131 [Desarmillaria tabescens]
MLCRRAGSVSIIISFKSSPTAQPLRNQIRSHKCQFLFLLGNTVLTTPIAPAVANHTHQYIAQAKRKKDYQHIYITNALQSRFPDSNGGRSTESYETPPTTIWRIALFTSSSIIIFLNIFLVFFLPW